MDLVNETPGILVRFVISNKHDANAKLCDCACAKKVHRSKQLKNESENQWMFIPTEICSLTGCGQQHRSQRSVTTVFVVCRVPI